MTTVKNKNEGFAIKQSSIPKAKTRLELELPK
jgi:hypothetical protein